MKETDSLIGKMADKNLAVNMDDIDEIGAYVTRMLGTADAPLLTEVCGEINLTIPGSAEGNVNKLLKLLNRYLNSDGVTGDTDEGLAVFKAVAAVLEKQTKGVVVQADKNVDSSDGGGGKSDETQG